MATSFSKLYPRVAHQRVGQLGRATSFSTSNLIAMASNLLAMEAIATRWEAIASRLEAIVTRLEAIATRLEFCY